MKQLQLFFLFIVVSLTSFAQEQWIDNSLVPYRSGDKWGYADEAGKVVIAPKYADADWFHYGMAAVKVGNKWGYINKDGKLLIPARYTVAKGFRKGYMPNAGGINGDSLLFAGVSVRSDGYEVCINSRGIQLRGCPAIPEESVADNRTPVREVNVQKTYSVPGSEGLFDRIIDDYRITNDSETYYIAHKNGKYGVFNTKFDTIVPFEYDSIRVADRKRGLLEISKGGVSGLSSGSGTQILPASYTYIQPVITESGKEYVIVKRSGMAYLKDMNDADIIPRSYYGIEYDPAYDGFILTGDQNLKGYYFLDNKVIEPKYRSLEILPGRKYIRVKSFDGNEGIISVNGTEYFESNQ